MTLGLALCGLHQNLVMIVKNLESKIPLIVKIVPLVKILNIQIRLNMGKGSVRVKFFFLKKCFKLYNLTIFLNLFYNKFYCNSFKIIGYIITDSLEI